MVIFLPIEASGLDRAEANPSPKVLQVLDSLYPGEKSVTWTSVRRQYKADFIYQDINVSVLFDREGRIKSLLREISFSTLPEKVREKIEIFYRSFKIMMVLERNRDKRTEYEVHIIRGDQQYILSYHPKGYLIHQYDVQRLDPATQFVN